jgi:hypothetical protein
MSESCGRRWGLAFGTRPPTDLQRPVTDARLCERITELMGGDTAAITRSIAYSRCFIADKARNVLRDLRSAVPR